MLHRWIAVVGLAIGAQVAAIGLAGPASAHPLGNLSVNHANNLVVSPGEVLVTHVVDLAEIPTVQAMPSIDSDSNEVVSSSELNAFAATRCADDATALALRVDGGAVTLRTGASTAAFSDGQAGLDTLRIECELPGVVEIGASTSLEFADTAAAEATGWSEVTLQGDDVRLESTNVSSASPTAGLTAYPSDRETSPLRVSSASAVVTSGARPRELSIERVGSAAPRCARRPRCHRRAVAQSIGRRGAPGRRCGWPGLVRSHARAGLRSRDGGDAGRRRLRGVARSTAVAGYG